MRAALTAALLLALGVAGTAAASEQQPTLSELERELICPTCQESLALSSSPIADRMRSFIRARIAAGDTVFIFASKNEGGAGLVARGVVTASKANRRKRGIARQTPRVSITIRRTALAKRRLGRSELKLFSDWNDGRPETELNFKFYRQATNKIVGISEEAAAFLRGFFLTRPILR